MRESASFLEFFQTFIYKLYKYNNDTVSVRRFVDELLIKLRNMYYDLIYIQNKYIFNDKYR